MGGGARVAAFWGLGIALHVLVSVAYVGIVSPRHKARRSDAAVAEAPDRVDLWIAGDSHPRSALSPGALGPRVVNGAVGGEHYLKTTYRVPWLAEAHGKDVGALMLPIDAASFSSWHAEAFAPEYIWGRYVDFFEVGRFRRQPLDYLGMWAKSRIAPYTGELRTLNQLRSGRYAFAEALPGDDFSRLGPRQRRNLAMARAKDHLWRNELIDPGQVWAFHRLLDWAKERDIRVILVSFPVTDLYDAWVDRLGARRRVVREVLAPLSGEGYVFFDDHALYDGRHEVFADPHHLNQRGRKEYSALMRGRLMELGIVGGGWPQE